MAKPDKLLNILRTAKIVSMKINFAPKRVRAEWTKLNIDEIRECFYPEVTFNVEGREITANLGRIPKSSPGDVPLGPTAEVLRSLMPEPTKIKLDRSVEVNLRIPLTRLMTLIIDEYEECLNEIVKDSKIITQVQQALNKKKKKMAVKALQSVFRRTANQLSTEEIIDMWNTAQIRSILED